MLGHYRVAAQPVASRVSSAQLHTVSFFFPLGQSGTQSTITEATTDLLYQPRMVVSVEQSVG
jgi:hypothetical protein